MHKRNFLIFSLIIILCISFLIHIQCSDKSMNSQTPGNVGINLKLTTSALLQMVSQLHIVVTADDMDTIEVFIPLSEENGYVFSEAIEVPSGADRLFVVEVLDDNDVILYRGEDTSDVSQGVNITLTIHLEPQVSLMKLNPRYNHKQANSLLNLTFEVFNIDDLYEIYYKVYFRSHLFEFISATIDTSLDEATTSFFVDVVHPVTMEPSYLDIVLKGTNNIPIVDENGSGSLVNLVFRCQEITTPVESTYIHLDYTRMLENTGFPPLFKDTLLIDSCLVKIVLDTIINEDSIPSIPSLVSPENIAVDVELNPTLVWSASARAQLYSLVLATDVSFNDVFASPTYFNDTFYQPPQLLDNTTYYWQVKALNEFGFSDWSISRSFTTLDNTAPSTIADLQISDTSETSATLTWTAPGNNGNTGTASSYDMRFANDISTITSWDSATQVTSEPTPQIAGSAETMTVTGLELENWYYFGIKTTDDAGNISLISNIDSIFLSSGIPEIPILQLPENNAIDVAINPILEWNATERAQLYNLIVATDILFNDIYISPNNISGTSYQLDSLFNDTTYYWQVQAINDMGMSEWSEVWSFTTLDNTAPAKIIDLQISDTSETTATLIWTAPGDNGNSGIAARYDIRHAVSSNALITWDQAIRVTGEPTPQISGSNETMIISDLELENWYYFGIKTTDEAGNISPLSNIDSIYLSSNPTAIPAGFSIDYGTMGLDWKADWDTRTITFKWTLTGTGSPDGFKIYARDNKTNTVFAEVADIPYQEYSTLQTGTVTLPSQFDSHTEDGLHTPFSDGTIIEFNIRAYLDTIWLSNWGLEPVSISDETPPSFIIEQIYGDADNTWEEALRDVTISLDRQLEYCLTSGYPSFSFIENSGDESYTLPVSSVNWYWDIDGRKDDTAYIRVPPGKCGAGDLLVVTIRDNSNNAFTDTLNILSNITITGPTSSITTFEAPFKFISWTFAKPPGTNYTNTLDFFLSLDGGLTFTDTIRNFAYDTDSPRSYVLNDNWMSENARIGLQNQGSGTIWWSEIFRFNGIELVHPTIEEIQSHEVIYDRGNLDSTLIPMSWNSVGIDTFIIWYSVTDTKADWVVIDTVINSNSYDLYLPNLGYNYYCNIAVSDADSDNRPIDIFDYGINIRHDTLYTYIPEPGAVLIGGLNAYLEWSYSGGYLFEMILQYSIDGGKNWIYIDRIYNEGYYSWATPSNIPSSDFMIRIRDMHDRNTLLIYDNLRMSGFVLIYPNGGELFEVGTIQYFTTNIYDPLNYYTNFNAYLSINDWANSVLISNDLKSWIVPDLPSKNARIRIIDVEYLFYDETDGPFMIDVAP